MVLIPTFNPITDAASGLAIVKSVDPLIEECAGLGFYQCR
jgi:hypothetical protein